VVVELEVVVDDVEVLTIEVLEVVVVDVVVRVVDDVEVPALEVLEVVAEVDVEVAGEVELVEVVVVLRVEVLVVVVGTVLEAVVVVLVVTVEMVDGIGVVGGTGQEGPISQYGFRGGPTQEAARRAYAVPAAYSRGSAILATSVQVPAFKSKITAGLAPTWLLLKPPTSSAVVSLMAVNTRPRRAASGAATTDQVRLARS